MKYIFSRGLPAGMVAAAVVLGFILLLYSPATVHAQEEGKRGLAISPTTFELSANPGDNLINTIRLDNISDTMLEVTTDVRNFSALGEEGQVTLDTNDEKYSLRAWLGVEPANVVLGPGESKVIAFTIDVPPNGEPGGHFGSVIFSTKIPRAENGSAATVGQEIGALVLLRVAGDAREVLKINSFNAVSDRGDASDAKPVKLVPQGPVVFDARIANEGNVFLKPKGVITITDVFNRSVAEFPLDAQNVLPEAVRKMNATWNSKFLFGKYDAQLTLTYGLNNSEIITATTSFWAFPYKSKVFMIGLVVILFILFASIKWRKRLSMALRVLFGRS